MRIWIGLALEAVLVMGSAQAQPCSPIRFLDTPQVTAGFRSPRTGGIGLVRQPDGSFQSRKYSRVQQGLEPASIEVGPVNDNYQSELYRCSGFATPAHMPNPGVIPFSETQLGIPASAVVFADFTGAGRFAGAGIEQRIAADAVIVAALNAAFQPEQAAIAYPTGVNPRVALAGDFNGDGSVDLAVTFDGPFDRSAPGGVSILPNNGDGTFGQAINTTLGNFVGAATAWDWNQDGRLDLAVSQNPSELLVLQGNGDGTFAEPVSLGEGGIQLAVADVTGDGNGDLLVTGTVNGFAYFPGNAAGGFGARVSSGLGAGSYSIATGDFNADGRVDVALGSLTVDQVTVSINTGTGQFGAPTPYQAGRSPESLMATDFDGDGNLDVVVASGHPQMMTSNLGSPIVAVLRGRGDGSFLGRRILAPPQNATGMAIADFNGDNSSDVAVADEDGSVVVFLGTGDGGFGEARLTDSYRNRLVAIAAGDFNDDDSADVVVADSSQVAVLLGAGNGSFGLPRGQPAASGTASLVVGDFDGDGRDDAALASSDTVQVFLANADGSLGAARNVPVAGPISIGDLTAGDLNGDGLADLVVSGKGEFQGRAGGIRALLATGGGAFTQASSVVTGTGANGALPVEFTGDANVDLIVTADGENFTWLLKFLAGDGVGGFSEVGSQPTEFGPGRMAEADLNSDGVMDLVVLHCCGQTDPTFLLAERTGSYQSEVGFFAGADPAEIGVADFNGDGKQDLAILSQSNSDANGVTLLLNESEAASATPVHVSAASFAPGPLAPAMLVTAFGHGFAAQQETATSTPLPTELAGTRVAVTDSTGVRRESQLIFMGPGQANYFLDQNTALGVALVTIEPASGDELTTQVDVRRTAPGLFFLNSDHLAAALILRVNEDGEQSFENVFEQSAQGALVARAIDFGPSGDRLFLLLFGTGFRNHAGLEQVRLTVGGIDHAVAFAGDQGAFVGLDQANAELSRELAGRGAVDVVLEVEGTASNTVSLLFQ